MNVLSRAIFPKISSRVLRLILLLRQSLYGRAAVGSHSEIQENLPEIIQAAEVETEGSLRVTRPDPGGKVALKIRVNQVTALGVQRLRIEHS